VFRVSRKAVSPALRSEESESDRPNRFAITQPLTASEMPASPEIAQSVQTSQPIVQRIVRSPNFSSTLIQKRSDQTSDIVHGGEIFKSTSVLDSTDTLPLQTKSNSSTSEISSTSSEIPVITQQIPVSSATTKATESLPLPKHQFPPISQTSEIAQSTNSTNIDRSPSVDTAIHLSELSNSSTLPALDSSLQAKLESSSAISSLQSEVSASNKSAIVQQIADSFAVASQASDSLILPKRQFSPATPTDSEQAIAPPQNPTVLLTIPQPLALPSRNQPLILRQGIPVASTDSPQSARSSATSSLPSTEGSQSDRATAQETPLITATEIATHSNSLLQPQMIWRKSAESTPQSNGSSNSSAVNNGVEITHYTDSSRIMLNGEDGNSASGSAIVPSASTPVQGVNIAQVAEQVSQILNRRLAVERERRGINQW
jgi:hypothetical protein